MSATGFIAEFIADSPASRAFSTEAIASSTLPFSSLESVPPLSSYATTAAMACATCSASDAPGDAGSAAIRAFTSAACSASLSYFSMAVFAVIKSFAFVTSFFCPSPSLSYASCALSYAERYFSILLLSDFKSGIASIRSDTAATSFPYVLLFFSAVSRVEKFPTLFSCAVFDNLP